MPHPHAAHTHATAHTHPATHAHTAAHHHHVHGHIGIIAVEAHDGHR
jgi:hypothetical protein